MASWFPSRACTRPPLLRACFSSFMSRSSTWRESAPRSSTSPVCTKCVFPPIHSPLSSRTFAERSTETNSENPPCTSPIATIRETFSIRSCAPVFRTQRTRQRRHTNARRVILSPRTRSKNPPQRRGGAESLLLKQARVGNRGQIFLVVRHSVAIFFTVLGGRKKLGFLSSFSASPRFCELVFRIQVSCRTPRLKRLQPPHAESMANPSK